MTAENCTPLPEGVARRDDGVPATADGGPGRPAGCDIGRALQALGSIPPTSNGVAGFSCGDCRARGTVSRPAQNS